MPKTALIQISSLSSLKKAWKYLDCKTVGSRRESAGVDNISINQFTLNAEQNILIIQKQIRSQAGYQFHHLKAHIIPKANGKQRVICVPTLNDRIVQRAVVDFLSDGDKCKIQNTVSYGFVRKRTVEQAVSRAKNLRHKKSWVYKTDITAFFDEIDRDILKKSIEKNVKHRSLHNLLIAASKCEIIELKTSRKKIILSKGIKEGRGVRQGMPLSPFFANLLLKPFDSYIEGCGLSMVRYADDFVIFSKTKNNCKEIHNLCKNALNILNLKIPEVEENTKTQIYPPNRSAEFLGIGLVKSGLKYKMNVLPEQMIIIKAKLYQFSDFKYLVKNKVNLSSLNKKLEGSIAGYVGSYNYADNLPEIIIEFESYKKDILTKIYRNGLSIDIKKLTSDQLYFLGLS